MVLLLRPQARDQREAVHLRQHAVDDQNVVAAFVGEVVAGDAVGGVVDGMAGFAQRLDEIGGGFAVVFDQQDAHEVRLTLEERQSL